MVVISSIGRPDITITVKDGRATCPTPYYHELFHAGVLDLAGRWDGRAWTVHAQHLDALAQLVRDNYYTEPKIEEAA